MKFIITVFTFSMVILFACAAEPSAFEIESLKPGGPAGEERIMVTVQRDTVVFDIHDAHGIGGLSITPKKGAWPKSVVLRLHLGGLESIQLGCAKVTLFGSVLSHSGHERLLEIEEAGKKRKAGKDDPLWADIRMVDARGKDINHLPDPNKGGCFEVTVPPTLLGKTGGELTLRWIDFFR